MKYIFDYEIHIAGLQRSGLHAISNWIIDNFKTAVYKNDAVANIYGGIYKFEKFSNGKKVTNKSFPVPAKTIVFCHENNGKDFLLDYQNNKKYIESTKKACLENKVDLFSREKKNFLNLRDPYNNFASAWKLFRNKELLLRQIKIWIKSAEFVYNEKSKNVIPILFNKWIKDESYRRNLLKFIENYSEKNINKMMHYGGGSSFSKTKHSNNAKILDLENRWKYFINDSFYRSLFIDNSELSYYSEKLFNFKPF